MYSRIKKIPDRESDRIMEFYKAEEIDKACFESSELEKIIYDL